MTGEPKAPKHEFRVTVGVELPPDAVKRIAQAIQRSVLAELASVNLEGPLAIDFLGRGGHHTQGIWIQMPEAKE